MLFVTWRERVSVKWNRIWLASSKWMKSTWINWNLEHFATAVVKFRANVATFNRKQQITLRFFFFFLKINVRAAFFFSLLLLWSRQMKEKLFWLAAWNMRENGERVAPKKKAKIPSKKDTERKTMTTKLVSILWSAWAELNFPAFETKDNFFACYQQSQRPTSSSTWKANYELTNERLTVKDGKQRRLRLNLAPCSKYLDQSIGRMSVWHRLYQTDPS